MPHTSLLARLPPAGLHSVTTAIGAVVSACLMTFLLWPEGPKGFEVPARLVVPSFSVAVMSGTREEAKVASPEVETVVPEPVVVAPGASQVVTEEVASTLPAAVTTTATPVALHEEEAPADVEPEVIPPAQVAMPGGKLMAVDANEGSATPDILSVGRNEVLLRYLVNEEGSVIRGGISRQGSDPLRDMFIHKAMKSRKYNIQGLLRVPDSTEKLWMVELVIPYGEVSAVVLP